MEEAIWTPLILHLPPPSHHSIHTSLHPFIQLRPHIRADPCAPTTSCMVHSPALHTAISRSLLLTYCLSAPLLPPPPHHPRACLTFSPHLHLSCCSLYPSTCHFSLSSHLCCLFHHSITQSPLYLLLPVTVFLLPSDCLFTPVIYPFLSSVTTLSRVCVCVCVYMSVRMPAFSTSVEIEFIGVMHLSLL